MLLFSNIIIHVIDLAIQVDVLKSHSPFSKGERAVALFGLVHVFGRNSQLELRDFQ